MEFEWFRSVFFCYVSSGGSSEGCLLRSRVKQKGRAGESPALWHLRVAVFQRELPGFAALPGARRAAGRCCPRGPGARSAAVPPAGPQPPLVAKA